MKKYASNALPRLNDLMGQIRQHQETAKALEREIDNLKKQVRTQMEVEGWQNYFADIPNDPTRKIEAYIYSQTRESADKEKAKELLGERYGEVFTSKQISGFAIRAIDAAAAEDKMAELDEENT